MAKQRDDGHGNRGLDIGGSGFAIVEGRARVYYLKPGARSNGEGGEETNVQNEDHVCRAECVSRHRWRVEWSNSRCPDWCRRINKWW